MGGRHQVLDVLDVLDDEDGIRVQSGKWLECYDVYYPINDDVEGDDYMHEEALDPSAGATDNAIQRSSEEAEMDDDL